MPIGKIAGTAGKGADYSAGSQNIQHAGKILIEVYTKMYCDEFVK